MSDTNHLIDLKESVAFALQEDIGSGDITAELINSDTEVTAQVISRDQAIICGQQWVNEVFTRIDPSLTPDWMIAEAELVTPDQPLFKITGNARSILTGERTALNFLQTLSGTATITHHYSQLIAHTSTRLLDTRKTLPGLRRAQKYAVTCGGGKNHRIGLFDAYLIKENHIYACGSITKAITKAKSLHPERRIEIEVENLEQLKEAIDAQPDWIMLDNFSLQDMATAVLTTNKLSKVKLEASGGIHKDADLIAIAETGVDYISIGALTKNTTAVDLSMRIIDNSHP
ncbi:MAG: carboxylating nicotinate-nucleotide diphosphorylase [Pseudomonadales bacterium]|nr:carboxylating nicotinate-nucleotide diphosphorylase [Pseudomonadales bacterium]